MTIYTACDSHKTYRYVYYNNNNLITVSTSNTHYPGLGVLELGTIYLCCAPCCLYRQNLPHNNPSVGTFLIFSVLIQGTSKIKSFLIAIMPRKKKSRCYVAFGLEGG